MLEGDDLLPAWKVLVIPMPALYPHSVPDIAFAPVLIGIEANLERLRASEDLEFSIALDLNDDDHWYHTAHERAERIRRCALRDVELHGLEVDPTDDGYGLRVSHGDYAVSIMLGKRLAGYVEFGMAWARFPEPAAA